MRTVATVYTELLRNTPLTLVLLGFAVVVPNLGLAPEGVDSQTQFFILAAIGLTLYTSPFIAEALRSGVNSIPVGQAEAARSIGLGFGQTLSDGHPAAGDPHGHPADHQRAHRAHQEHLGRRRVLRRRADRRLPCRDQRRAATR